MADEKPAPAAAAGSLDAGVVKLRDSAKWLIAAFGAIGTLTVAGLQFSDLGKLEGEELAQALAGIGLAFFGTATAIWGVTSLLAPRGRTLTDLAANDNDPVVTFLNENKELLQGFPSVAALATALHADHDAYYEKLDAFRTGAAGASALEVNRAARRAKPLASIAAGVVAWANYLTLHNDYRRTLRLFVLPALIVIAIGLTAFTTAAADPPVARTPVLRGADLEDASMAGAKLLGVDLSKANLAGADLENADLSDANLKDANLAGTRLVGANLRGATTDGADFDDVEWKGTTCPDGENSDTAGGSCEAHLSPPPDQK